MNLYEELLNLAGIELDESERVMLTEGIAELKRQYPNISDNDYQQLIRMDPTYGGGNEIGKFGRWILDLYNLFVKDRLAEEKYEQAKEYVTQHPEAKMPPVPVQKSIDKIEDFQKLPDLLAKFVKLSKDIKQPINSFKSVADLASAIRTSEEKDISVDEKAQANYKIFRDAISDGLKVVYQDNDWVIGVPETYEASSHFKEPVTNWCTAYPDMYERYISKFGGKYYIHLNKHTGELYQLHVESNQFKDASDREINRDEFAKENPQLKAFYDKIIPMEYYKFWKLHNKTPTEAEQLAAVEQNGWAIEYIHNPSEEIQLAAVEHAGQAIRYIKNPSEKVQLAAVKQDGWAIRSINSPSEQMQLAAVRQNGWAIEGIKNPSEQIQLAAVRENGMAIEYIKNPSEQIQLAAVEQNCWAIQYIKNPSEQVQLAVVEQNGYAIKYIVFPSEEVQLAAVRQNEDAIEYIKNPYPSVIKYVEGNG